jgi:hypothetical protein
MPTQTRSRTAPRFSRTATPAATPRRSGIPGGLGRRRQPPKRSGPQKAMDALASALPGKSGSSGRKRHATSSSKARRGGKAGGVALVGAAAGMAFKNRGKLMDMLSRRGDKDNAGAETAPVEAGTRPAVGSTDPIRSGNIAPTDPGNRPDIPAA